MSVRSAVEAAVSSVRGSREVLELRVEEVVPRWNDLGATDEVWQVIFSEVVNGKRKLFDAFVEVV